MPTRADMPNTVLGRFLSLEMLGMLVMIGVSWGSLTSRVSGLDIQVTQDKQDSAKAVSEIKSETSELKKDVALINRKLDVMGNNQQHFKEQIDGLDDRSVQILEVLQDQSGADQ